MGLLSLQHGAHAAAVAAQGVGGQPGLPLVTVDDREVVAVMGDGGRDGALVQVEIAVDRDGLRAGAVAIGAADEIQRGIGADIDLAVLHGQLGGDRGANDGALKGRRQHVDRDGTAGIPFRHPQLEGFGAGDLGDVHGVGERHVLLPGICAHVHAVFGGQLSLHEHRRRTATVEFRHQLHVGDISGGDGAQVVEAVFPRGVESGQLDGLLAVDARLDGLPHDPVDMADGQQIGGVDVVGAEGNEIPPGMILAAVHQEGEVVHDGAGSQVDMDAIAELLRHFRGAGRLVIGDRPADAVGRQGGSGDEGGVALQEHAALDALLDDGGHTVAALDHAHVVHDLGDADHVVHVQDLAYLLCEEHGAGGLNARHGRHGGRRQHILAKAGLFGILQHELDAFDAHHVADLMGIRADGGGAPGQDGAGQVFGDHHGALHVHVSIDEAGDEIVAFPVVVIPGGHGGLDALFTDTDDESIQHVYAGGIDLSGKHVEQPDVADRQIAGDLPQGGLDQLSGVFCLSGPHSDTSPLKMKRLLPRFRKKLA